jgi:small subunit ribosomal protein S1
MFTNFFKQLNAEEQEPIASNEAEATATTNEPAAEPVKVEARIETAHDDFDWSRDKRNVAAYSKDERAKYDAVYDATFKQITDGEMIQATVES